MCSVNCLQDEWYSRLLERSKALATRRLGPRSNSVDDVVSEVMLKVVRLRKQGIKTQDDIERMLGKLVRNASKDVFRRGKRRARIVEFDELQHSVPVPSCGPPFTEITAGLAVDEVSLISARYVNCRTDDEIAGELGCSRPTVTRRVQQVLKKLQKQLLGAVV